MSHLHWLTVSLLDPLVAVDPHRCVHLVFFVPTITASILLSVDIGRLSCRASTSCENCCYVFFRLLWWSSLRIGHLTTYQVLVSCSHWRCYGRSKLVTCNISIVQISKATLSLSQITI